MLAHQHCHVANSDILRKLLCFVCFVWGTHLKTLGAYSWLCVQGITPDVLQKLKGVPGIEARLATPSLFVLYLSGPINLTSWKHQWCLDQDLALFVLKE